MINLREYFREKGYNKITDKLRVCGYSNIRNCGLIVSQALGADVAIFIDNDEVIEDSNFLNTVCEYLNESYGSIVIHGKGGFYLNRDGKLVDGSPIRWWQILWKKNTMIAKTFSKIIDTEGRLVDSPIILGGNLAIHKSLFRQLPFDPLISRGEDIDYLINARIAGFNILFDKELKIRHLPPSRSTAFRKEELKGDIERFLYEREKAKDMDVSSLEPYPGYFLQKDLELKTIVTVFLFALNLLLKFKVTDALEVLGYIRFLFKEKTDALQKYLQFRKEWICLMELIEKDETLKKSIIKELAIQT